MPLQSTSGAASYDAFGGGVAVLPKYIEDYFSAFLYTGNGSTQTINNGIDLSTKGGLVWGKNRDGNWSHYLADTARGTGKFLESNTTSANTLDSTSLTAFNANGFSIGNAGAFINNNGVNYVSWTWAKAPKFFDVVTWTGSNDSGTSIGQGIVPHNLGSAPGCVIIKNVTQGSTNWIVYHRSLSGGYRMLLNTTDAQTNSSSAAYFSKYVSGVGWTQTDPDANNIYVGYNYQTNGNGDTLVAYVFAHNAGGFGLTGTDNVISCGSFTTDGSGNGSATLGYEPQWVLFKRTDSTQNWVLMDNMRNFVASPNDSSALYPNLSSAESVFGQIAPNATGFSGSNFSSSASYIYIAIRRGPMKVPTSGTSVFDPAAYTGAAAPYRTVSTAIKGGVDMVWNSTRALATNVMYVMDRLRANQGLRTSSTTSEGTENVWQWDVSSGVNVRDGDGTSGYTYIDYAFKRAPGFFDVVCYNSNGVAGTQIPHNLGVKPELMIVKCRNNAVRWVVYAEPLGATQYLVLNLNFPASTNIDPWNNTEPTASVFTVEDGTQSNAGFGYTYVAYLFASAPGVSKVGSYTGNGSSQTINCGFTGGARFVMIKATSTTGDWMVADSARGIVSGNDPYLELNNTNAEVTGEDWLDTDSTGFVVNEVSGSNANTNGVTYIYLAIA